MGGFFGQGISVGATQGLGGGFFGAPISTPTVSLDALIDLAYVGAAALVGVTATGNAAYSSDGGTTTHAVIAPLASINAFVLVQGDGAGHAVAIGQDPNQGNRLVTTVDGGHTWTDTTPAGMTGGVLSLYYSSSLSLFIASPVANGTRVFSSPDGVTWTLHAVANRPDVFRFPSDHLVETGGLIYIGGGSGVQRSADGLTFTQVLPPPLGGSYNAGPCYTGTLFGISMAAAFFPPVESEYTSATGANLSWTHRSDAISPFTSKPYPVLHAYNGQFVSGINAGNNQTFATSPDCITWTDVTPVGVPGFAATSVGVFLPTATALYLFGAGVIHSTNFMAWALDVAVTNTVNNMKTFSGAVVGCGADAGGNGLFFKVL